jgi:hypothetical protein
MERKNVEHFIIHVVASCVTMEFIITYYQGKMLPNKERNEKKMKTHESKACLLFVYCIAATIVLQQLSSCNYCHLQT